MSESETFSLEEYAKAVRGSSAHADCEWVARRLRSGEFPGFKAGRYWRGTQSDIDEAIELCRPRRLPKVPLATSLTQTSRRRLAS